MTYQSFNPATGKLLKTFEEISDKKPKFIRTQQMTQGTWRKEMRSFNQLMANIALP